MLDDTGLRDKELIEQVIKKFLEQKSEQIGKKLEFDHTSIKPRDKNGTDILFTEVDNKRRLNIFEVHQKYSQLVIVGEPGSGKTSSLLRLYSGIMGSLLDKKNIKNNIITGENIKGQIPVFIELNLYRANNKGENWIYDYIANDLNSFIRNVNIYSLTNYLLHRGKFLILLDGLNEVSIRDLAKSVKEIREFLLRYPKNKIIITARQQDYKGYFSIPIFNIQKMDTETIVKIVKAELSFKNNGNINIDEFYNRLDNRIKRLIQNPMLLMMFLNIIKKDSNKIPTNRGSLYSKFIDFWFEREEKKAVERPERIERIVRESSLASIGFALQMRGETITSEEFVCEKFARNLIRLEKKRIIKKGKFGGLDILSDLKSIGFIEENYGMVKFFHPSFLEFYAAVELRDKDKTEVLRYSNEVNWEETMNFYYGLIDDSSFFIEHFLKQNSIFDAANCIIYGESNNVELIKKEILQLLECAKNKYEYFRDRALECLIKIDNPMVDNIINKIYEEEKNESEYSIYNEILQKRKILKKYEFKRNDENIENEYIVSEKKPVYSTKKDSSLLLNKLKEGDLTVIDIEEAEEHSIHLSRPEFVDMLTKVLKNSGYDVNIRWYAAYLLEVAMKKWGIDIMLKTLNTEKIKKLILDVEDLNESQIDKKYILMNLLIDQRVDKNIRRKLCTNHINDIEEGMVSYILKFIEKNLMSIKKDLSDVYCLIIDCLYRVDASFAEDYLIFLLKKYQTDSIIKNEITETLRDKIILEKNYKFFVSNLEKEKEIETKKNIISAISNTRDNQLLIPLLSLIKNDSEPVIVKRKAIEAIGELGDMNIVPLLKELSVEEDPEIYNSAFNAFKKIERRKAFEESYLFKTDIREIEIEEEVYYNGFPKKRKTLPKVILYKDMKEIIEVENVVIKLGLVSGLIFFLIAVNTTNCKPINIDSIVSKLDENGIYIQKIRIKGRIADIRKKIKAKFGEKINPHFLIENIRKYGYRINASVKII